MISKLVLVLPHSNAGEERVFSLIQQNKTPNHSSLNTNRTLSSWCRWSLQRCKPVSSGSHQQIWWRHQRRQQYSIIRHILLVVKLKTLSLFTVHVRHCIYHSKKWLVKTTLLIVITVILNVKIKNPLLFLFLQAFTTKSFLFRLLVCNARYTYIYIICVSTRDHNNEFILEFILCKIKMADFERW